MVIGAKLITVGAEAERAVGKRSFGCRQRLIVGECRRTRCFARENIPLCPVYRIPGKGCGGGGRTARKTRCNRIDCLLNRRKRAVIAGAADQLVGLHRVDILCPRDRGCVGIGSVFDRHIPRCPGRVSVCAAENLIAADALDRTPANRDRRAVIAVGENPRRGGRRRLGYCRRCRTAPSLASAVRRHLVIVGCPHRSRGVDIRRSRCCGELCIGLVIRRAVVNISRAIDRRADFDAQAAVFVCLYRGDRRLREDINLFSARSGTVICRISRAVGKVSANRIAIPCSTCQARIGKPASILAGYGSVEGIGRFARCFARNAVAGRAVHLRPRERCTARIFGSHRERRHFGIGNAERDRLPAVDTGLPRLTDAAAAARIDRAEDMVARIMIIRRFYDFKLLCRRRRAERGPRIIRAVYRLGRPCKLFRMDMTLRPPGRAVRYGERIVGVVNHPPFSVCVLHKRAVSRTVNAVRARGGEDRRSILGPRSGGQRICTRERQNTVAVILRPASRCRIDDVRRPVLLQNLRSLVDGRRAVRFPGVGRRGQADARGGNLRRRGHLRNINLLRDVGAALPARPDKVNLAAEVKHRAVDCPMVVRRGDFADHGVVAECVLGVVCAQDVHTVIGVVLAVIGGDIDIPARRRRPDLACREVVQFRRPVFFLRIGNVGHARVEHRAQRIGDGIGTAERNAAACRHLDSGIADAVHRRRGREAIVVDVIFFDHIRVGFLQHRQAERRVFKRACRAGQRLRAEIGKALHLLGGKYAQAVLQKRCTHDRVPANLARKAAARDDHGRRGINRIGVVQRGDIAFRQAEIRGGIDEITARNAHQHIAVRPRGRPQGGIGRHRAVALEGYDRRVEPTARYRQADAAGMDVHARTVNVRKECAARDFNGDVPRYIADRLACRRAEVAARNRLPCTALDRNRIVVFGACRGKRGRRVPAADKGRITERVRACAVLHLHTVAEAEIVESARKIQRGLGDVETDIFKIDIALERHVRADVHLRPVCEAVIHTVVD